MAFALAMPVSDPGEARLTRRNLGPGAPKTARFDAAYVFRFENSAASGGDSNRRRFAAGGGFSFGVGRIAEDAGDRVRDVRYFEHAPLERDFHLLAVDDRCARGGRACARRQEARLV